MRILVTGVAGFIGAHTAKALLKRGDEVVGIDNFNPYYDQALKQARLAEVESHPNFEFHAADLVDKKRGRIFIGEFSLTASFILLRNPECAIPLKTPKPISMQTSPAF